MMLQRRLGLSAGLILLSLPLIGARGCPPPICSDLSQTTLFLADFDSRALYSVHPLDDDPFDRIRLLFMNDIPAELTGGHIAATPDARRIYFIEPGSHRLFYYDVLHLTWTDVGTISGLPSGNGVTQAVIDNTGTTLYVGVAQVGIYSVNLNDPALAGVLEAVISGTNGGDITFGINGELYQANRTGTLDTITFGNPLSPTIVPVGNGDLGDLKTTGLTSYPFLNGHNNYQQLLVASVGPSPTAPFSGLAVLNPEAGPNDPPFITVARFFLDGSLFVHNQGDLAVATCF